ncbi:fibronectin type III domain-containing protein [Candidatus Peribacteria bacterium]|jgi:hypothetical protein|nr:fibronectin type III domain-containing protein [Candidatus Peribacteria bacterium]MBT4021548.1 fibronectin type III domain-containing protein [Candidatus Peribacteria bacterium]MBT4240627.1 fibronectin type III domain-containing protein [Candidatus Peribacteria bacterium]MBT4474633.1 fibronectin type III domain-containing protein [Candidatus Peribacteria bacterium]
MKIKYISIIVGLIALFLPTSVAAEELDADTFAGFGTEIVIEDLDDYESEQVNFVIFNPDEDVIEESVRVRRGKATLELGAEDTTIAGYYDVELEDSDGNKITSGSFEVFEDVPAELVRELLGDSSPISDTRDTSESRRSSLGASLLDEYDRDKEEEDNNRSGFIDHFDIEIENRVVRINEQMDISIIARDRNDKRVDDYIGEVIVETTDPDAQIPISAVKFFASDRGVVDLPLAIMFGTPGTHTMYISDDEDENVFGEIELRVVGRSSNVGQGQIAIEMPKDGGSIANNATISGTAPAYINLELVNLNTVNGEAEVLKIGESDKDGKFRFQVSLDPNKTQYEFMVREGEGGIGRESQSAKVTVDAEAPQIHNATLMPDTVLAGTAFSVSISADSGNQASVKVGGNQPVVMPEGVIGDDGKSTYQATIDAPDQPGSYTIQVTIKDSAGNGNSQSLILTVQSTGLPVVAGVKAQPVEKDVLVSWSSVHNAAQYRIYFGPSAQDLSSHVDTASSAPSARLTGLNSSQTYYFAVSALDPQNRESVSKSEVVSAATQGSIFGAIVTPRVNGAFINWTMPNDISASKFSIRYGVQPGMYTEQRIVSGTKNSYEFIDLMNGINYYILISAVKDGGEVINDVVESTVVPGSGGKPGFHFSANESPIAPMGGPGITNGKVNISAASSQVQMPQSGGISIVWTVLLGAIVSICILIAKKNNDRKKLLASIATSYDYGVRLR